MPERPCGPSIRQSADIVHKCLCHSYLRGTHGGCAGYSPRGNEPALRMPGRRPPGPAKGISKDMEEMSERITLPVLPLRETVIFPGTAVPISAGRPGTLQAVEAALAGDRRMLAVAQKENRDDVEADNLYDVGTVVRVAQVQRNAGGVQLL